MQFCKPHWDKLQEMISYHGLGSLVSKDGITAAKRAEAAKDGLTVANFDPLMGAHNRLIHEFIRVGGPGIIAQDDCPVCLGNHTHKENCIQPCCTFSYDAWIEKAAEEMKQVWDELQRRAKEGTS